jgi:hypothetical protein
MWPFKPKRKLGYWIMVRWSDAAEDYALGYECLKKIYHLHGDGYMIPESDLHHPNPETYSLARIEQLRWGGTPIHDSTYGKMVPDQSILIPPVESFWGAVELRKRLQF